MAWIESHQDLREHPKTYDLMEALGADKAAVLGHLHLIWWWCVDYALDGVIRRGEVALARAAEWKGDPQVLVEALLKAGFIDRIDDGFIVHDWKHYCGSLVEKRLERRRSADLKTGKKRAPKKSVRLPNPSERTPTQHNLTIPNQTKETGKVPPFNFEPLWNTYPNKDGKREAERHFKVTVQTEADYRDIQKALGNYLRSERVKKGFVKNGSTWFNNWRDWVNYREEGNVSGNGQPASSLDRLLAREDRAKNRGEGLEGVSGLSGGMDKPPPMSLPEI